MTLFFFVCRAITTHDLQPLDRAFFKSLKSYFYEQCRNWLNNHPGRRITRSQFGTFLSESWGKSKSQRNASSGFNSTGIYPFNPSIIPDYAFISDFYEDQNKGPIQPDVSNESHIPERVGRESKSPQPGTSKSVTDTIETPSKFLCELSPVPEIDNTARKRAKQVAEILTSKESIKERKQKIEKKQKLKILSLVCIKGKQNQLLKKNVK